MSSRRRLRQALLEPVAAAAERGAQLAQRVGLHPDRLIVDGSTVVSDAVRYHPVAPARPIPAVAPVYVDEASADTQRYRTMLAEWGNDATASTGIVTVTDAAVSMPTGLHRWHNRVFREGLLGVETLHNPKYLASLFAMRSGWLQRHARATELDDGVLLALPWNHNVFHWLVEMLPRLQLVERVPELREVPLLVPASAPAFVAESLRLSGFAGRVTHLDDGVYRVKTLHIPSRLAATSDVSPDAVRWLDERLPDRPCSGRRLYISRADAAVRYVSNDDEVAAMLAAEHGFETIVMSDLTLEEQVGTFREASVIVGAHGAAFAHLAFAPSGAAVLELFQRGHFNHCYGRLAAIRDLRYGFLVGERDGLGTTVDLDALRPLVGRMVHDTASVPA